MPRPKLNLVYCLKSWNYITLVIITSCGWKDFWPIICRITFTDYGSGMVSWEQQNTAGVTTTIDWLWDMHLKHTYNLLWTFILETFVYTYSHHDINSEVLHPYVCRTPLSYSCLLQRAVVPLFYWLIITQILRHMSSLFSQVNPPTTKMSTWLQHNW